eukprot:256729-Pleurochrysis_carterae.AAC.2
MRPYNHRQGRIAKQPACTDKCLRVCLTYPSRYLSALTEQARSHGRSPNLPTRRLFNAASVLMDDEKRLRPTGSAHQ